MRWRGRARSTNVVDRRGQSAPRGGGLRLGRGGGMPIPIPMGRRGGFGSIVGLVVILGIIWFATGVNPIELLSGGGSGTTTSAPRSQVEGSTQLPAEGEDELADFVAVVVRETEDLWNAEFAAAGQTYDEPTVVLFSDAVESGCGVADAQMGPFYCPLDSSVYIDLSFYDRLHREFGAPGDLAQAYVLAHEVGHHIQNLTGVLPEFNRARQSMSAEQANAMSVRIELQADCYAGVWANYAGQQNLLQTGDIDDAINAASQIGDDVLQERSQGFAVPKTFTHGTAEQRRTWFTRGYEAGDPGACDTLEGPV